LHVKLQSGATSATAPHTNFRRNFFWRKIREIVAEEEGRKEGRRSRRRLKSSEIVFFFKFAENCPKKGNQNFIKLKIKLQ
jgi:hypothetical protein